MEPGEWTRFVLVVGRAVRATVRLMYCAIGGCGTCDGTIDVTFFLSGAFLQRGTVCNTFL